MRFPCRPLLLVALAVLIGNAFGQDIDRSSGIGPDPVAARKMLDNLRHRAGFLSRELAGQNSTASTLVLFDQTRPHFLRWQALLQGSAAESAAEAAITYLDDTRTALDILTRQVRLSSNTSAPTTSQSLRPTPPVPNAFYEIVAGDDSMANIVGTITRKYSLRVCFEELDLDPYKDGVTAAALVRDLEARAGKRTLTNPETQRLEFARKTVKEHGPRTLVDSGAPRLTLSIRADTPEAMFDQVTAGTPYAWKKIGGTFVVLPRAGSVLDFPVTVNAGSLTVQEAAERIAAQRQTGGPIGLMMIFTGVFAPGDAPMSRLKTRLPPMDFQHRPALEALTLIAEATRPDFVWNVAGHRQCRFLGLNRGPDTAAGLEPLPGPSHETGDARFLLNYEDASMAELIARIRAAFSERLCFEASPDESLGAAEVVSRLNESSRFEPLTPAQKRLLTAARKASQGGEPFDASLRFSGRAAASTFESFLDQITRSTPYAWRQTAGAFVVFPLHGGISQNPLTMQGQASSLSEAVRQVLDTVQPALPMKPKIEVPQASLSNISLDFDAITVAEALCRIGGSSQPPCVWDLHKHHNNMNIRLVAASPAAIR